MMTAHIDSLLDDYMLDLLPAGQRRMLEDHVTGCPRCMELLADERARAARLAAAFRKAATAPPGRLGALWPGVVAAVGNVPVESSCNPRECRGRMQRANAGEIAPPYSADAFPPYSADAFPSRPRINWRPQWRAAFATFAVLFLVLAGLLGVVQRFDGWLMGGTFTPTAAAGTASPTVSLTPTWTRPSNTPNQFTVDAVAYQPAVQSTPEPVLVRYAPQPQPNPSAPPAAGR